MWQGLTQMRFAALVVASVLTAGQAALTEPVSLHAANAAEAADVAQQAAKVAKRVAAHTEEVATDTAAALRYTRDALKRAGADAEDVDEVGRQADQLEEEAGVERREAQGSSGSYGGTSGRGVRQEIRSRDGSAEMEGQDMRSGSSSNSRSRSGRSGAGSRNGGRYSNGRNSGGSGIAHGDADAEGSNDYYASDGNGGNAARGNGGGVGGGNGGGPRSLDVNAEISPYPNGVEPFGQEEPAKELTEESIKQSDGMINQIENAQGVEAKRSVYRALTKLRGATIASYDGMAKGHLKNVDNYNKKHSWRSEHPMRHLAEEEADTPVWAFPKGKGKKSPKHTIPMKKKKVAPAGIAAPAPAPAA